MINFANGRSFSLVLRHVMSSLHHVRPTCSLVLSVHSPCLFAVVTTPNISGLFLFAWFDYGHWRHDISFGNSRSLPPVGLACRCCSHVAVFAWFVKQLVSSIVFL